MKKILFLTTSPHMYQAAGGRTRIVSEIRYALGKKYQLLLLCFVPARNYKSIRQLKKARLKLSEDTQAKVVYFFSLPTWGIVPLNKIKNFIQAVAVRFVATLWNVGLIHGHGSGAALYGCMAKKMGLKIPVVGDIHGNVPEEYAYAANAVDPAWFQELEREEKAVLEQADFLLFVSEAMRLHYQRKYGFSKSNYTVVPCATTANVTLNSSLRDSLRHQFGVSEKIVFTYAGSYRKYQRVEEMIQLFAAIKKELPEAFLLVMTNHNAQFSEALSKVGLSTSDYTMMSVPHQEVFSYLQMADIGFLLRDDDSVNEVASPTKFAEYCICGVPVIITSKVGDFSKMVQEANVGFMLHSLEYTPVLLDFARDVQRNRALYAQRCHAQAQAALTWATEGDKILETYQKLGV